MPAISFSRSHRLREPGAFQATFRTGRKARGAYFSLYWKRCESGEDRLRVGVSVGKRAHRLATIRNRIKRLIKEAIKKSAPALPKELRGDAVVIVHKLPDKLTLSDVQAELILCFQKLEKS